jgi:PAS domain S-box-containing protein
MESLSSANIIPFTSPAGTTAKQPISPKRHKSSNNGLQNNLMFSSIWETSNEGMRLTDEKGVIVLVNPAFCLMVGMTLEELVGRHFTCICADSEDHEKMTSNYEGRFREHQVEPQHEHRFVLWTNHSLDVEVHDSFIESDDGQVLMLTRFRNITAEKVTHRALIDSESKYRGLFANSVMAMFQSSVDGKLLNANRAMLKLLGYNNFYELAELDIARDTYAHPEERKAITEILHQKGYIVNAEIRLKRKNGKVITVLESARTLRDEDGNVIGYEGVMEDITARKAMEKKLQEYVWALERSKNALAELNAQKDKLFSILSHDLRSPFSSILGFCDILLKENDQLTTEDRMQFISYIQEAAQDQLSLVNKLLDWSRLESGRIQMERVEFDVLDVVKKNMNTMIGLAHQKQVNMKMTLPGNVLIYGDRQLLGQVFGNLIGNSLKFTPPDGTISVELVEERNNQWVIGVHDTGIGIPEEDLNKLFKIEEKYTRKGLHGEKGTGLGLPVVHEIIQKHHGTIEVKSKPGEGTLFIITLPKSRPAEGETILIVDDEAGTRVLHSRYINRILPNANVLHTSNGTEVSQLARDFHPKVMIIDNDIPDLDGNEMVRNLKADPVTGDIPIIIVTGYNSDVNRQILMKDGAAVVLNKPVTPEQLADALNYVETRHAIAVA